MSVVMSAKAWVPFSSPDANGRVDLSLCFKSSALSLKSFSTYPALAANEKAIKPFVASNKFSKDGSSDAPTGAASNRIFLIHCFGLKALKIEIMS